MTDTTKTVLTIAGCTAAGIALGACAYFALDHFGVLNKDNDTTSDLIPDAIIPEGNLAE